MIVANNEITEAEAEAVLSRMKAAPFRAQELSDFAQALIQQNPRVLKASRFNKVHDGRDGLQEYMLSEVAGRLADRLIQRESKAGTIKQRKRSRTWDWIG